jgi:hypothetical protein
MKVMIQPVWPGFFLVFGAFLVVGWFAGLTDVIQLTFGILLVTVGVLMLSRPYFEFDATTRTILFKPLLGSQVRQFGGAVGSTLDVVNQKIVFTRPDGSHRAVPVKRFFSRRSEWDAVVDSIVGSSPRSP